MTSLEDRSLAGRVAVVAGASRGIGMGAAIELGAAGAYVYLLGRTGTSNAGESSGSLAETKGLIEQLGGQAVAIACDCTDSAAVAAAIDQIRREKGRLDILVNSVFSAASFRDSIGKRFWEVSTDLWRSVVDLGSGSAYIVSALAAPLMMETAARENRTGLIVNVSGRGAVRYRYNVAYGVGKSATERLTRDVALELREHGVAVVSIWPNAYPIPSEQPETPRFSGRAVVGLANDPSVMAKSGRHFWSAELSSEYDFVDEFGHSHGIGSLTDEHSLEDA